jgi:hypothetical protein
MNEITRRAFLLCGVGFCSVVCGADPGRDLPAGLGGRWCTIRALDTSNVEALSKDQIVALKGTTISFSAEALTAAGHVLRKPHYERVRLTSAELVEKFMVAPKDLGVHGASVVEVDTRTQEGSLAGFPGDTVFLSGRDRIVWYWKGVFFEAERCTP